MVGRRLIFPVAYCLVGFGIGVLWSPLANFRHISKNTKSLHHANSALNARPIAVPKTEKGSSRDEILSFAGQFEEMITRIKEFPINAWASPDGRFVIRLFGSDETIASDLYYPEIGGGVKELVRHYSFTFGNQTFSCDFGRSTNNQKMTGIQFRCEVDGRETFSYVDLDGDGQWVRWTGLSRPRNVIS